MFIWCYLWTNPNILHCSYGWLIRMWYNFNECRCVGLNCDFNSNQIKRLQWKEQSRTWIYSMIGSAILKLNLIDFNRLKLANKFPTSFSIFDWMLFFDSFSSPSIHLQLYFYHFFVFTPRSSKWNGKKTLSLLFRRLKAHTRKLRCVLNVSFIKHAVKRRNKKLCCLDDVEATKY